MYKRVRMIKHSGGKGKMYEREYFCPFCGRTLAYTLSYTREGMEPGEVRCPGCERILRWR